MGFSLFGYNSLTFLYCCMLRIVVVILNLCLSVALLSQASIIDSSQQLRPKVGLVLSGGAAHGFAHIGVIKYLEEIGIHVDYITGTSMGAIIGGFKAMGYDANQMTNLSASQDWSLILSTLAPLDEVTISEKEHYQKNPYFLVWDGEKLNLPNGIIGGQKMDLILSSIYCPAHFIDDFNMLPTPFRCVAVDLITGDIVTLSDGYLGKAIRASMAIPSVFSPVEDGDRLFVDGGLRRNFPVEENVELGADILIGSYVGSRRKSKDDLNSLVDILTLSTSLSSILDSEEQSKLLDVLMIPEISNYSYFDFDSYQTYIDIGYKTAKNQHAALMNIKNRLDAFDTPDPPQKLDLPDAIKITKIVLHTSNETTRQMILGELGFGEGESVSLSQIELGTSNVFGTNYFDKVSYNFFPFQDGVGFELVTTEKAPFKFGVNANSFQGYDASLILNAEIRNLVGRPSRIQLSTRLSQKPGIDLLYQNRFARNPRILFQLRGTAEEFDLPFYVQNLKDREYTNQDSKLSAGIVRELNNRSSIELNYKLETDVLLPQIVKNDDILRFSLQSQKIEIGYKYSSLNDIAFADHGLDVRFFTDFTFDISANREAHESALFLSELSVSNNFSSYGSIQHYHPLRKRFVWQNSINFSLSTANIFMDHTRIGGTKQNKLETLGMSGLNSSELLVGNFGLIESKLRFELNDFIYISPSIAFLYGKDLLDQAFDFTREDFLISAAGLEVAVKTPIGPVILDFGYSTHRELLQTNFSVGYRHIL